MPAHQQVMGEDPPRFMLESERSQLLFLLAMRTHNTRRHGISNRPSACFLELVDGSVYENWPDYNDEHDHAICDSYYR